MNPILKDEIEKNQLDKRKKLESIELTYQTYSPGHETEIASQKIN